MTSEELWDQLERSTALKDAMVQGQAILNGSDGLLQKQAQMQSMLQAQGLSRDAFTAVHMKLEEDLDTDEETSILEVWHLRSKLFRPFLLQHVCCLCKGATRLNHLHVVLCICLGA